MRGRRRVASTPRALATARPRRLVAALAAVALVLPLTACMDVFLPPNPRPTSTPTGEEVAPELEVFYGQQLVWERCGDGMQCTTAAVPLDWGDPSAGRIELALARHPAPGTPQGSLLVNPGGPGGSGRDMVMTQLDYAVGEPLQRAFDVVGYDPRGVGASTAVHCSATPAELDEHFFDVPDAAPGTDAWITEEEAANAAFAADCDAHTGPVLGFVDTVSSARDLDLLRAVLGDATLTYLGYSYGSKLGAVYAQLYPQRAGRLVLDGALEPNADSFTVALGQAQGFERALADFAADCLDRQDCPLVGPDTDAATAQVGALLDAVDTEPIAGPDGRELDSRALFTAIIYPLYSPASWATLRQVLQQVEAGSADYAFRVVDAYYGREGDGRYTTNSTEAFTAVNCLDYVTDDDRDLMREQAKQLDAAAPVFGRLLAYDGTACAGWPVAPRPLPEITGEGTGDILVVGGLGDPATPYEWAVSLARLLPHGHLVTADLAGHTSYNKGSECVDRAVEDYLIDGVVPTGDVDCR